MEECGQLQGLINQYDCYDNELYMQFIVPFMVLISRSGGWLFVEVNIANLVSNSSIV